MNDAPRTVRALIDRAAREWPNRVYAVATETGQTIDYAVLVDRCVHVGRQLRSHGLSAGDTVSLVMPNGLGSLQWLLGAMHGGFAVNPVNLLSQPDQMRYVLDHSDCRLVLVAPEWAERVRGLVSSLPRPVEVVTVDPDSLVIVQPDASDPSDEPRAAPTEHDLALLMYTSGTTGNPKGVMLTQGNLAANAQAIAAEHMLSPEDRVLGVLPLYHINAFAVTMLAPLASGGSVAMAPRFSVGRFWEQAASLGCTWLNVVPTMVSFLLEHASGPDTTMPKRMRFCRSASAALPPEHLQAFQTRFGIGVIETMGLTETVAPSFSNPLDPLRRKLGSVGLASGGQAQVVDAQGHTVPDGTTGEILIRGPHVMRGYYKNPSATADAFTADGWLRTGDLGHRDADGFYFVTGRIKELIIKGGENIAPREIDEAVLKHPGVLDAAAVGIPDRHYGQEIMVCVVRREGSTCDEASLRAHCEQTLGRYKTPSVIRFVESLPRGPSGKVQRLKLLALV